ncbi:MAG TPA: universal stress protein [Verrucomicrobiae bacterium]|nr:universal stress protein [Verrucomicrobiae bacterium]
MKTPRIHTTDRSLGTNVLMENQLPVRTPSGETGVNSHNEDRSGILSGLGAPSHAARRSTCPPPAKVRTILLPLDFTESARDAFGYALSVAKAWNASIVLLHVVDATYPGAFLHAPGRRGFKAKVDLRAREKLDTFVKAEAHRSVPIRCVVRHGVPDYEILRLAETMDIDLIVLGRRRRSALSRLMLGSVTHDVIDAAPCPVAIVPASRGRSAAA